MKRHRLKLLLALLAVLLFVFFVIPPNLPAAAEAALAKPDQFELLSLEAAHVDDQGRWHPGTFHRQQILGTVNVSDAAVRLRLTQALRRGASRGLLTPMCFNPRHAIRVTTGGVVTDILICFECEQCEVWQHDQLVAKWYTGGSPQTVFDAALTAGGIALAKW